MASNFDTRIENLTGTDSVVFTDAQKLVFANYTYNQILNEINDVDPTRYDRTTHAEFTADQTNFSLPVTSGVQNAISGQIQSVLVKYDSSGLVRRVEFQQKRDIDKNATHSQTNPVGWWEKNNYYILPVPDTTVSAANKGIELNYSLRPAAMTAITDEPDFDKEYWELIPLGVAADYLQAQGDYQLSDRYRNDYKEKLKQMRMKVTQRGDENFTFVPFQENYN